MDDVQGPPMTVEATQIDPAGEAVAVLASGTIHPVLAAHHPLDQCGRRGGDDRLGMGDL
jgi:hypothetical protein